MQKEKNTYNKLIRLNKRKLKTMLKINDSRQKLFKYFQKEGLFQQNFMDEVKRVKDQNYGNQEKLSKKETLKST
ncbi:MAG: hypothetical protein PHE78_03300 [Candidatus Gastranaerophilales bacterium]|nr:hypothetical protein [Candidatus Gastranaerophilales bacterium]